ncbi:MAG: tRNA pseudouridine(55) synthase TruB [Bifidobacterium criceti]|nr:tRNA pseudouridine(55) synthase TruB [Bifidobacterium criceti]
MGAGNRGVQPLNGLFIVDKPQGVTSHDIVGAVRAAVHMRRVGHAGTLDPMATGVLVVGVGHATRLLNVIVDHTKTYAATVRFGQRTTTDDADGAFVVPDRAAAALPDIDDVRDVVSREFHGTVMQVPNAYSAIKVHGKRAYDLARAGEDVTLDAREVTISRFDALDARDVTAEDGTHVRDVDIVVTCSAGTYIRAVARDLGERFGCGAHLTRLRRLAVGDFRADDACVVTAHVETREFANREGEQVTRNRAVLDVASEDMTAHLIEMADAVREAMPTIAVSAAGARDLRYGRRIPGHVDDRTAAIVEDDADVVAIVEQADATTIKPTVVFPAEHDA